MPEMVTVRMVQQLSGRRPDGRFWPNAGDTIDVSPAEAAELCHVDNHQSHPVAVMVSEPGEERATADETTVETATPKPVRQARPAPRPAVPATEKRG